MTQETGQYDFFTETLPEDVKIPTQGMVEKKPSVLTNVEQEIYDSFSQAEKDGLQAVMKKMDLNDPNFRSQYGKSVREGIADISDKALDVVRTRDLGEAGKSITNLISQLKGINLEARPRGLFGRVRSTFETLNTQLSTVSDNIDKAVAIMQGHQTTLREDNVMYDRLYGQNLAHYKNLTKFIIAGKLKLDEERRTTLAALRQKAESTGDMADIEAFDDYREKLDKFDKRLKELEATRLQCMQTAPTLRLAKSNNEELIDKFDDIFLSAVPSWKNNIQIALGLENTRKAAEAANDVIDYHNEMIRQNAEMLGKGAVLAAQVSERQITDTATLEFANQKLLESFSKVLEIKEEGRKARETSRIREAELEEEMKNALLSLARG